MKEINWKEVVIKSLGWAFLATLIINSPFMLLGEFLEWLLMPVFWYIFLVAFVAMLAIIFAEERKKIRDKTKKIDKVLSAKISFFIKLIIVLFFWYFVIDSISFGRDNLSGVSFIDGIFVMGSVYGYVFGILNFFATLSLFKDWLEISKLKKEIPNDEKKEQESIFVKLGRLWRTGTFEKLNNDENDKNKTL